MTGNDLKRIRESLKETQAQFALRLGYSHYQRILELEARGKRRITREAQWRVKALKLVD